MLLLPTSAIQGIILSQAHAAAIRSTLILNSQLKALGPRAIAEALCIKMSIFSKDFFGASKKLFNARLLAKSHTEAYELTPFSNISALFF